MIDIIATHAPMIGLLFFFTLFLGVACWALKPSNRMKFQNYSEIPLNEDRHG